MVSIKSRLLISIIIVFTISTACAGFWSYINVLQEVEQLLDLQLIESNKTLGLFLEKSQYRNDTQELQKSIEENEAIAHQNIQNFDPLHKKLYPYEVDHVFAIWNAQNKLILHSAYPENFDRLDISELSNGFSELDITDFNWRIYFYRDQKSGIKVLTGQRLDLRTFLAAKIARDHLLPLIFILPLLGLFIWLSFNTTLRMLSRVVTEVKQRDPDSLDPISETNVPTEIKPLITELNRLFSILHDAFEREKRFTADAAHELKTPLAALKTQIEATLTSNDENKIKESLQKIVAGVDRSAHLINQLLTISRLSPDRPLENAKIHSLETIVTETMALLVPYANEKSVELEFYMKPEDLNTDINCNETAISILVRNLIDNAIRYSKEGDSVSANILEENNKLVLYIVDTGPGIADDKKEVVFQRFYRGLGHNQPGSGLGLSIVSLIIKLHGADIKIEDNISANSGTIFKITFLRH